MEKIGRVLINPSRFDPIFRLDFIRLFFFSLPLDEESLRAFVTRTIVLNGHTRRKMCNASLEEES